MARLLWRSAKNDTVYTKAQLKQLVEVRFCAVLLLFLKLLLLTMCLQYAADRSVRVVPEFDMPGHGAWNYGMPEMTLTSCPSILDVSKPEVYKMLIGFLGEMADIFPDPVLMLGGDEVGLSCRDKAGKPLLSRAFDLDKEAAKRLKALRLNSSQATDYFWKQVTQHVMTSPKLKEKVLQIWYCPTCHTGDPPLLTMPKNTIADVWGSLDYAATACVAGYRSVMSMSRPPNASLGEAGSGKRSSCCCCEVLK